MTDISANEARGPRRQKKTYSWILILVAIASGVGVVLFFSVPIFFSPGGGIGAPTSIEEEEEEETISPGNSGRRVRYRRIFLRTKTMR